MKITQNGLVALLLISSLVSPLHSYEIQNKQANVIIKKLKKAWRNNWVKAGAAATTCALLYSLGTKFNIFTSAASACTGTAHCGQCNGTAVTSAAAQKKLIWQILGLLGLLSTGACAYAYYNEQDSDCDDSDSSTSQELELDDDFFEFDGEVPSQATDIITRNVAEEIVVTPSDITPEEMTGYEVLNGEEVVYIPTEPTTPALSSDMVITENSGDFQTIENDADEILQSLIEMDNDQANTDVVLPRQDNEVNEEHDGIHSTETMQADISFDHETTTKSFLLSH